GPAFHSRTSKMNEALAAESHLLVRRKFAPLLVSHRNFPLQLNNPLLYIPRSLRDAFGFTQIAPIKFVRAKAENLSACSRQAQIRSDNRERAVFGEFCEEAP